MNSSVSPDQGRIGPRAATVSSTRTVVVPTAMTRLPRCRQARDGLGGAAGQLAPLAVHGVLLVVALDRLKGADADVQRDMGPLDAALPQAFEELPA